MGQLLLTLNGEAVIVEGDLDIVLFHAWEFDVDFVLVLVRRRLRSGANKFEILCPNPRRGSNI